MIDIKFGIYPIGYRDGFRLNLRTEEGELQRFFGDGRVIPLGCLTDGSFSLWRSPSGTKVSYAGFAGGRVDSIAFTPAEEFCGFEPYESLRLPFAQVACCESDGVLEFAAITPDEWLPAKAFRDPKLKRMIKLLSTQHEPEEIFARGIGKSDRELMLNEEASFLPPHLSLLQRRLMRKT